MGGFDAELYLRLLAEETLLGGEDHGPPWESPLTDAADALLAVGAIEEQTARSVLEDYMFAAAMRGERGFAHRMRRGSALRGEVRQLQTRRVVACEAEIEIGGGTLHVRHVELSGKQTRIAVGFRREPARRAAGPMAWVHRSGGLADSELPEVTVRDDRSTSATTHFSGGGSDVEWDGHLDTDPPLAADTAWIEIAAERIELDPTPPVVEVRLEALEEGSPVERHLWRRMAAHDRLPRGAEERLDPAIAALLAAGALAGDDPLIAQLRAVCSAMPRHFREPPGRALLGGLPQPWRSLLARRGREDGPTGTIAIGAVTPIFDGRCAGLIALHSGPSGFVAEVEEAPGEADATAPASRCRLTWWARDDRANHYLGQLGEWSGDDEGREGKVNFWPALDPQAQRLDVMPTGQTQRAVIEVPLRWAPQGDEEKPADDE